MIIAYKLIETIFSLVNYKYDHNEIIIHTTPFTITECECYNRSIYKLIVGINNLVKIILLIYAFTFSVLVNGSLRAKHL